MSTEVKQEGEFKLKSKKKKTPKKLSKSNEVTKVDLTKPEAQGEVIPDVIKVEIPKEDAVQTQETDDSNAVIEEPKDSGDSKEVVEEIRTAEETVESPIEIIEEVGEVEKELKEAIRDEKVLGKQLPENIEKLVSFMEETGGNVEDYVRLNADYSSVDDTTLLKEYYKKEKPYLDNSDIDLLLEDFQYDEDLDEDRDIRKKKLAFKEEVAKAKNFLESTKEKYYADIKLRSNVNPDAQKAMDFFNRYNKQQEQAEENRKVFQKNTKKLFTNDFEGFDISVGQKKYRYKIQNADGIADKQSDINNLIGKFLDKNGSVSDYKGYHKAMYAAENVDRIAAHFYEQGKADAVKGVIDNSKNLSDKTARPSSNGDVFLNGFKVKAISGADSTKLKVKTKKFN
tara:strand:- start:767 stop:1957 length:1191 start_codon:yes stop_codon:yes gene_type:complete